MTCVASLLIRFSLMLGSFFFQVQTAGAAEASDVVGTCKVRNAPNEDWIRLESGHQLKPGDEVKCTASSRVTIIFENEVSVRLIDGDRLGSTTYTVPAVPKALPESYKSRAGRVAEISNDMGAMSITARIRMRSDIKILVAADATEVRIRWPDLFCRDQGLDLEMANYVCITQEYNAADSRENQNHPLVKEKVNSEVVSVTASGLEARIRWPDLFCRDQGLDLEMANYVCITQEYNAADSRENQNHPLVEEKVNSEVVSVTASGLEARIRWPDLLCRGEGLGWKKYSCIDQECNTAATQKTREHLIFDKGSKVVFYPVTASNHEVRRQWPNLLCHNDGDGVDSANYVCIAQECNTESNQKTRDCRLFDGKLKKESVQLELGASLSVYDICQ
jgi:hypothetical protein